MIGIMEDDVGDDAELPKTISMNEVDVDEGPPMMISMEEVDADGWPPRKKDLSSSQSHMHNHNLKEEKGEDGGRWRKT